MSWSRDIAISCGLKTVMLRIVLVVPLDRPKYLIVGFVSYVYLFLVHIFLFNMKLRLTMRCNQ